MLQVKADIMLFARNTLWTISEGVRDVRVDALYKSTLPLFLGYLYLEFTSPDSLTDNYSYNTIMHASPAFLLSGKKRRSIDIRDHGHAVVSRMCSIHWHMWYTVCPSSVSLSLSCSVSKRTNLTDCWNRGSLYIKLNPCKYTVSHKNVLVCFLALTPFFWIDF